MLAAIKHITADIIIFFRKTAHYCNTFQLLQQKNFQFHGSWVLSYSPSNSPVLSPIDYKISKYMLQHEHKLWVKKIEKKQALLAEMLESSNTSFEKKNVISVLLCFTR